VPVKVGASDTFNVEAGAVAMSCCSGHRLPTTACRAQLGARVPADTVAGNELIDAAAGGTVYRRTNVDVAAGSVRASRSTPSTLQLGAIDFQLARQDQHRHHVGQLGNVFFGFQVSSGSNPANLTSGIARISKAGVGS